MSQVQTVTPERRAAIHLGMCTNIEVYRLRCPTGAPEVFAYTDGSPILHDTSPEPGSRLRGSCMSKPFQSGTSIQ